MGFPVDPTDSDKNVPTSNPILSLADSKLRSAAFYAKKANSDINQGSVQPVRDPKTGKRRYESSPVALARLMGSPLPVSASKHVVSLQGTPVRLVTSGWNDTRSTGYDDKVDSNRRHGGLDFPCVFGETVLSVSEGVISFVGVQHRKEGSKYVEGASVDSDGNILDKNGNAILPVNEVGFGGIFVQITHTGTFVGFKTEYMHLSKIAPGIIKNKKVVEGEIIGYGGVSGGYYGRITSGTHLHWQARYNDIIVKPEGLVLHYNPNSPSESFSNDVLAETMIQIYKTGKITAGEAVILGSAAASIRGQNRAVDMENQSLADIRKKASEHSKYLSNCLAVEAATLHQAVSQFNSEPPTVNNPMTYNFTTGLWSDGKIT